MTTEFVFDDSGNYKRDPETGFPLVKRNGREVPLDADRLFTGIDDSNRDAAKHRKAFESASSELSSVREAFESMKAEMDALKTGKGKDDKTEESAEMREIKALKEQLRIRDQEKKDLAERAERRESSQILMAEIEKSGFAAEHSHIPADVLAAYFAPQAYMEAHGSPASYEEIDGRKQWVFRDRNGDIVMSEKRYGKPADFSEFAFTHCAGRAKPGDMKLAPAPAGGSGAKPLHQTLANSNPWAKGQENATLQHKIMAEDPALAQRLAASAGKQLPAY